MAWYCSWQSRQPRGHSPIRRISAMHIRRAAGRARRVHVTLGGQFLESADNAYISGAGIQAKVMDVAKMLTPKQVNDLRERMQELQKKPRDPETLKEMMEIRNKLSDFQNKRNNPVLSEKVILEIKIAADAEPGQRELRLATANGLSNPLFFHVGQLPEFRKEEAKYSPDPVTGRGPDVPGQAQAPSASQR